MLRFLHTIRKLLMVHLFILLVSEGIEAQKLETDITVIYWMPYDNNLSQLADTIYSQIQLGLTSDKVAVAIQKDQSGPGGMMRSVLTNDSAVHHHINDENSSSGKSLQQFLIWVSETISSDQYVMVFLDHGGKLDQVSVDRYPSTAYLPIDSIAWAVSQFNLKVDNKMELIYLQVCTKGSLEPLYELSDVSQYTMFSQSLIGAPNYYYAGFFKELSESSSKDLTGQTFAELITKHERQDMFSSLTCIENSKFKPFGDELKNFINNTTEATSFKFDANKVVFFGGQTYHDLKHFINAFDNVKTDVLSDALDELVVMHVNSTEKVAMKDFCGISLLSAGNDYKQTLSNYQHLRFYQDFDVLTLYGNMLKVWK